MAQPEPKLHTGASRFSESVGDGAYKGVRYGVLGAVGGLLAAAAVGAAIIGGGLALAAGIPALFATGETAAFTASALGALPVTAAVGGVIGTFMGGTAALVGGGLGALLGFGSGVNQSRQRLGKEHEVGQYMAAYNETKMGLYNQAMQQQAMMQEAAMTPMADHPRYADTKIDAGTAQRAEQTLGAETAVARG